MKDSLKQRGKEGPCWDREGDRHRHRGGRWYKGHPIRQGKAGAGDEDTFKPTIVHTIQCKAWGFRIKLNILRISYDETNRKLRLLRETVMLEKASNHHIAAALSGKKLKVLL